MKYFFLFTLLLLSIPVFAQKEGAFSGHYYGNKAKLGELEFINDSLYRVAFYFYGVGRQEYDTGYYRKNKDTIFLNSMEKTAFEFIENYYVKNDYIDSPERYPNVIFPGNFFISHFRRGYKLSFLQKIINPVIPQKRCRSREKYYSFIGDEFRHVALDTIDSVLIFPNGVYSEDILIIDSPEGVKRRIMVPPEWNPRIGMTYIRIKDNKCHRVYLNNFPLLIRRGKLKPCSQESNKRCFIDNGFFFPEMSDKRPDESYFRYSRYFYYCPYRGLIGFRHFNYGNNNL